MAAYQLTSNPAMILRVADGAYIPTDPANRDYAVYLQWVDEGNSPDPAPPPPTGPIVAESARALLISRAKTATAQGDYGSALGYLIQLMEDMT